MNIKTDSRGQKYIKIKIPKRVGKFTDWCDVDHLMFLSIGMLFEEYVVGEIGGLDSLMENLECAKKQLKNKELHEWDYAYYEHDVPLQEEILKLYKMWLAFPKYVKKLEKEFLMEDEGNLWHYYEELIHQLEDQFMRRVIDIRLTLWT